MCKSRLKVQFYHFSRDSTIQKRGNIFLGSSSLLGDVILNVSFRGIFTPSSDT